ncbi:hypothetical protein E4T42_09773 [Aureobasidium subglaciale]|nr:hypothetical protein E4T42_09773 [Aureobasidium subglaciale]
MILSRAFLQSFAHSGIPGSEHEPTSTFQTNIPWKRPSRPQLCRTQPISTHLYNSQHPTVQENIGMSVDAGINSMTGYCDIDSLLAAAYNNTCTTQTRRFQFFASQHLTPSQSSTQPLPFHELASPEVDDSSEFMEETSEPANRANKGRRRGRTTHMGVEQRYRHNIVSAFQKLASTIPYIQTTQPARVGQIPKPSKAEILLSASEYLRQLEREIEQLRLTLICNGSPMSEYAME